VSAAPGKESDKEGCGMREEAALQA